jgi:predicted metal-dependent hydrolase
MSTNGQLPSVGEKVIAAIRQIDQASLEQAIAELDAEMERATAACKKQRKRLTGLLKSMYGVTAATRAQKRHQGSDPKSDAPKLGDSIIQWLQKNRQGTADEISESMKVRKQSIAVSLAAMHSRGKVRSKSGVFSIV